MRGDSKYQRAYRQRHPKRVERSQTAWRRTHQAEIRFLNQRNKLKDKLAMQWLRTNRPDIMEACRKQACQMMPVGDLRIEREMEYKRAQA